MGWLITCFCLAEMCGDVWGESFPWRGPGREGGQTVRYFYFFSPKKSLHIIEELLTRLWGSDKLLMCSNVICKLDVPSGVRFVSLSERSSSALKSAKWFQWQKRPLSFWCLRSLCTSKWAFPKRWDRQIWQHRCPSHLAAPLASDLSLWSDRHSTMESQSRWV